VGTKAKIAAALAMPVLSAALVGGFLRATHHDAIPQMVLPTAAHARITTSHGSPVAVAPGPCLGDIPAHFVGIAVKKQPALRVLDYQKKFGTKPRIVEFYNPFTHAFNAPEANQALESGQVPLIQLNPWRVKEQQIAAGVWDRHLRNYARAVKIFGCAIILSFGHEMNGWWYPWGAPRTSPADFIAAWRHIHDIFARQGVTNVIWSWDPSHQYGEPAPGKVGTLASDWYPGDNYVDWIGLDGYFGSDRNGHTQNFKEIFGTQLNDIRRIAPHKLVYLAETGVAPGRNAPAQVAELFSGAAAYHMAGLVWFDAISSRHDYRLGVHRDEDAVYLKSATSFLR